MMISSSRIPHRASFLTANGTQLAYFDVGSGPAIIFVPGWTFSAEIFEHQIAEFSKTHRVVAIDPRSHGRSEAALNGNHYAQQAMDLAAVVRALDLNEIVLVSWSAGTVCSLEYFKQFSTGKVAKFVSIDQPPKSQSEDEGDWCIGGFDHWSALYQVTISDRSEGTRRFCEWLTHGDASKADLDWFVDQSMSTHSAAAGSLLMDMIYRDDIDVALSVATVIPVLNVIREDQAENAANFIKKRNYQTSVESFGAHAMFWEEPEKFNAVLRTFIN